MYRIDPVTPYIWYSISKIEQFEDLDETVQVISYNTTQPEPALLVHCDTRDTSGTLYSVRNTSLLEIRNATPEDLKKAVIEFNYQDKIHFYVEPVVVQQRSYLLMWILIGVGGGLLIGIILLIRYLVKRVRRVDANFYSKM